MKTYLKKIHNSRKAKFWMSYRLLISLKAMWNVREEVKSLEFPVLVTGKISVPIT